MSDFYFVTAPHLRVQPVAKGEGRKLKSSLHRASKVKSIHARNFMLETSYSYNVRPRSASEQSDIDQRLHHDVGAYVNTIERSRLPQ